MANTVLYVRDPKTSDLMPLKLVDNGDGTYSLQGAAGSGDTVATANATTNLLARDVIGNKSDTAVTTVGIVASIIAYVKGVLNQLAHATYGLSALQVIVAAIKTATDKLAGAAPGVGTTTANWNTGTGTSGETGADLVTLGVNDTKNKVLSLILDVSALTNASVVTVKMFMQVNGVEKKVYSEGFVRQTQTNGSTPDGIWAITGPVGIHEALRVEVYSSTNESKAIGYDYMLEAM